MKTVIKLLKNSYSSEDSKFVLYTALKIVGIGIFNTVICAIAIALIVKVNSLFFEAHGFPRTDILRQAYYDYLFSSAYNYLPQLFVAFIVLFFMGVIIAKKMLKPFKNIADYATLAIEDENAEFSVENFSDFRLLSRFSEYFFNYIHLCRKESKLKTHALPPQYKGMHKPVFDRVFFFHFSILIGVMCTYTLVVVSGVSADIYEQLVNMALKTLQTDNPAVLSFLSRQLELFDYINWLTIFTTLSLYIILAIHLYNSIAGAAFGVFSTLRSFMKGNYSARVHLIGYVYVRPYTRQLNKYLDYLERNYVA